MRRALVIIIGTVLAIAGTGCGSQDAAGVPTALIATVLDRTEAAKTAKMVQTVELPGGQRDDATSARFEAVVDLTDMKSSGALTFGALHYDVVQIGTTVYIDSRGITHGKVFDGRPWIRQDLATIGAAGGSSSLASGGPSSPDMLRGVTSEPVEVGKEVVDGERMTHYRMDLDLSKLPAGVPERTRDLLGTMNKALGGQTIPVDLWVDGKKRERKVQVRIDLSRSSRGAGATTGTVVVTSTFSDFGVAANVQAPPADQTMDLAEFQRVAASSRAA